MTKPNSLRNAAHFSVFKRESECPFVCPPGKVKEAGI